MNCETCDGQLLAELRALTAALVDQSRALEALAVAVHRQGLQGTLRVKIEAPTIRRGRKVRRRRPPATAEGDAR